MLRRSMALVTAGALCGLVGCIGLGRSIGSRLYGVEPFDLRTLIGASALLAVVTAIACGLPAGRAARANPVAALRSD